MLTGAILAGGQNKRMGGRKKALLPFGDTPLIQYQMNEMQKICDEIIVVTNEPRHYLSILPKEVRIITDYLPGKGPMSGMHAALSLANYENIWVVACDMPFILSNAAQIMVAKREELACDAVIPVLGGQMHPLHGIYHRNCAELVSAFLHSGKYRLSEMIKLLYWMEAGDAFFKQNQLNPRCVLNLNTPEEYAKALSELDLLDPPSH